MIHTGKKPPRRDERRRARERKRCPDRLAKKMAPSGATPRAIPVSPPKQKPLSSGDDFKVFSMMAVKFCRHNHSKPNGPVCRNTFDNAFATHDETVGFVAPKFHDRLQLQAVDRYRNAGGGVVCGGKMGHSVRLAAWRYPCYEHLAHPLHVVMQRVVSESHNGAKTMMQTSPVRTSAHHGHITTTDHTGNHFNRDVIAIANIENALQRVLYELKKASPDMARAQKLTLAAMAAVQYVGYEVLP